MCQQIFAPMEIKLLNFTKQDHSKIATLSLNQNKWIDAKVCEIPLNYRTNRQNL